MEGTVQSTGLNPRQTFDELQWQEAGCKGGGGGGEEGGGGLPGEVGTAVKSGSKGSLAVQPEDRRHVDERYAGRDCKGVGQQQLTCAGQTLRHAFTM